MNVTELGKFLRKLRIDSGEIMLEMANKLGMKTSTLSAVELGRRSPNDDFVEVFVEAYDLDDLQTKLLMRAVARSATKVSLEGLADEDKDLTVCFARLLPNMDRNQKEEISKFLGVIYDERC